jgi:gas vesicle protein
MNLVLLKKKKMENNKSKIIWGLAIGAAVGFVLGYLLSGKKVNEMGDDLKSTADNLKDKLNDTIDKSKAVINDVKTKLNDDTSAQV